MLPIEFRLLRPDGKISWFVDRNTIFARNINGAALTKIGITHEITERKAHEEELLRHKKIIEQSELLAGGGSWAYEHASGAFTWSKGMYTLFNLPTGTTVHPSIYKDYAVESDGPVAQRITDFIENAELSFEEILHINVDGHVRSLKVIGSSMPDSINSSRPCIGVDHDITIDEEKEKQLRRLNKELTLRNREIQYLHADLKTFADVTATDYQTIFSTSIPLLREFSSRKLIS